MTAVPSDVAPGPILPAAIRRLPLAPAEGWLTVAFVALMALTVAWSFDDAAWVLGEGAWGDFYAWGTLIAVLIGFGGAKVGWPRWIVHLVGAVAAALVLPVMVGSVLVEEGGSPGELYRATATAVVQAWVDLAILNRPVTAQTGHYLLTIGVVCWSVGQFAGYAVFGHRRPLDAVIVVGIVLIANMSMTFNDQLGYLVIFSVAALAVLARTHAFDEETTWIRRRIGDASAVRSLYLRGGAVFIATAIFGSLVLTTAASSAPLSGWWTGFDQQLIEWGRELQRILPVGGNSRPGGFGFSSTANITGQWESRNEPALTIRLPPGDDAPYYWRAVTYDSYSARGWGWSGALGVDRVAGQRVLQGLAENPTNVYARRDVTFQVQLEASLGNFAFSPLDPLALSEDSTVQTIGGEGWLGALEVDAESYTVTAAVPVFGEEDNGLTANRLRAATDGRSYPTEIQRYLELPPEHSLGPAAQQLLREFQLEAGDNPYDLAATMERRLSQSPEFVYSSNIIGLCGNLNWVDCFATHKRGYCMQFATTMAVLLREAGVPARMALGYLPGARDPVTGVEQVLLSGAHAWVEVWFPGFGWYAFDPTGGGISQAPALPEGPAVTPPPSVGPSFGNVIDPPPIDERSFVPSTGGSGGGPTDGGANTAVLAAVAILLLVSVGALAFIAWQRGPRGEVSADGVWRGIARTAGRFGFGPRPQETVYEYAGTLGEVLPAHRPELQTVARAKVEVAYGRRELGGEALRTLRDAQRRLRVGLLRLALRRGARGRFRR